MWFEAFREGSHDKGQSMGGDNSGLKDQEEAAAAQSWPVFLERWSCSCSWWPFFCPLLGRQVSDGPTPHGQTSSDATLMHALSLVHLRKFLNSGKP